jgi:hypothetical protein
MAGLRILVDEVGDFHGRMLGVNGSAEYRPYKLPHKFPDGPHINLRVSPALRDARSREITLYTEFW